MLETIKITPEIEEKKKEAALISKEVESFIIENTTQAENAGLLLVKIKTKYRDLESCRKSITQPINTAFKNVNSFFKGSTDILLRSEATLKRGLVTYQLAEQRKAQIEQARLNEIARKKEVLEKQKLERKAIKAEEKGQEEKAQEFRSMKDMTLPIATIAPSTPQPIKGQSLRSTWKWTITDKNLIPNDYLQVDEKQLNAIAKSGITGSMKIPGVKFSPESTLSVRI